MGERIRQLLVSPNGDLLAIATEHTLHIALLPDSSHLGQIPNKAIKLKTYMVGPTTHVLSQAQIKSVLWHPFGVSGSCLVTVTADAVARLWEFNTNNRWSFDNPSLAIDLRKLAYGSTEDQNYGPDGLGRNRRFSLDAVGLEVASACFGGIGMSDETPWSGMTLWVAMKDGDIYALCPLLPSKWQPSSTLIPALSASTVEMAATQQVEAAPDFHQIQSRDQYHWTQSLDVQEPILIKGEREMSPDVEVYSRPEHPGPIPRLQGPFQMFSEESDAILELADIYVIAGKLEPEELMSESDSDSEDYLEDPSIASAMVCLTTISGRIYVCLAPEDVEGQWLPRKKPSQPLPTLSEPYLVMLEGLDTLSSPDLADLEWPTISQDAESRYSFFTTHSKGVFYFSLEPWVESLEKELKNNESLGAHFRMDIIKNGPGALRERILSFDQDEDSRPTPPATACLVFEDSDLGYFLLTCTNNHPHAATLDRPYPSPLPDSPNDPTDPDLQALTLGPARLPYQPSDAFYVPSSLPTFVKDHVPARHQRMVREEIRLSTATLDLMTAAHRVLSGETHRLGLAAADLFRRCERLQEELRDQIKRASEVALRTGRIVGDDSADYLDGSKRQRGGSVDERLEKVRRRHEELAARHEALRRKFNRCGGSALSEKEKAWFREAERVEKLVAWPEEDHADEDEQSAELWHRSREVCEICLTSFIVLFFSFSFRDEIGLDMLMDTYEQVELAAQKLIKHTKEVAPTQHAGRSGRSDDGDDGSNNDGGGNAGEQYRIPCDLKKAKAAQVMKLLQRQYVYLYPCA